MTNQKQNTNLGFAQAGSAALDAAALVVGSKEGREIQFGYDGLRTRLANGGDTDYIGFFDDFFGDLLADEWAPNLSTGATAAINAQTPGVVRLSTDTDDDDFATLALGLHWTVGNGWTFFESRVKCVSATTLRAVEIGLSDALSETNGLAFSNHSVASVADVATDAVIFGYDTDASMTAWAANTVKNGTQQAANTSVAPSTSWQKFLIAVDSAGTAYFYIDGTLVATISDAVSTTAVLTPWISLKSLSGAIKSIDVDYVNVVGVR